MTSSVELFRLSNGFEFVYQQSPAAPVLALDLWVRAGSADETPREAGLAHLVEHMLFKGTGRRGPGEIAGEVEGLGGEINAYTSFDHTVYTLLLASRYAAQGIDILFDAVSASAFDPDELDREKSVVLEEIKRGKDLPHQHLSQLLFAQRYGRHPYGKPVIGSEETVSSFRRADGLSFVRRWYRAGNMALVAVGDRPAAELLPLVEASFGGLPPLSAPRRRRPGRDARPKAFHGAVEPRDVAEIYFNLAFPTPDAQHPDVVALDLLAAVLGHGEASRLQHRLKLDANLVTSIGMGHYSPLGPGLLYVGGGAEPARFPEAWKALGEELMRAVRDPAPANELLRAKETLEADFIYQRETVQGQAQKLGYCHAVLGDADYERAYLQKLSAATPRQVWDAARRYLTSRAASLCFLHPEGAEPPLSLEAAGAALRAAETTVRRAASPARRARHAMRRVTLDNGVRVLLRQNPSVPIVSLRAAYLGGSLLEPAELGGVFHLLSECLPRGTASRSVFDIAQDADRIGGHVDGFSGRNSFGLKAEFLSKRLDEALDLVGDLLANPAFPEEELEKIRQDALAAIKRRDDNPAGRAFRAFEKALYGDHPYGRDTLGELSTVTRPTADDLRRLHARFARPERLAVAVVGDVDPDAVLDRLGKCLRFAPGPDAALPQKPAPARFPRAPREEAVSARYEQTHVVVGFLGATIHDADRVPLRVANALLSGQGGRLFRALRDERALAYSVTSTCNYGVDRGYLAGYIATSPGQAEAARQGLLEQLTNLAEGLTEEELESAKRKLAGSYEISLQENSFQAAQMALDEVYGIDYRSFLSHGPRTLSVTLDEVRRVVAKYLRPDRRVTVTVGRNPK